MRSLRFCLEEVAFKIWLEVPWSMFQTPPSSWEWESWNVIEWFMWQLTCHITLHIIMISDVIICYQMVSDVIRWYQMLSDVVRCYQMLWDVIIIHHNIICHHSLFPPPLCRFLCIHYTLRGFQAEVTASSSVNHENQIDRSSVVEL